MSDVAVELRWDGEGLRFHGGAPDGPSVQLDGDRVAGPSPMQMLLLALAGCTAADVVDILGKMRLPPSALSVRMAGDRAEEPPRRYTAVRIVYEVAGIAEEDRPKLQRAIELSHEKYCSVLHTFRTDIEIDTSVMLRVTDGEQRAASSE